MSRRHARSSAAEHGALLFQAGHFVAAADYVSSPSMMSSTLLRRPVNKEPRRDEPHEDLGTNAFRWAAAFAAAVAGAADAAVKIADEISLTSPTSE